MSCPQSNPCSCVGKTTLNNHSTTCKSGCFRLGNILVDECDSIGPCSASQDEPNLLIPFDCFEIDCDSPNTLEFKIISVSKPNSVFINSITEEGIWLSTTNDAISGEAIEITFYGQCKGDCEIKSDYGSVLLYIKNKCKGVLCSPYQTCNKCTGNCVNIDSEVSIDPGPKEIYIIS